MVPLRKENHSKKKSLTFLGGSLSAKHLAQTAMTYDVGILIMLIFQRRRLTLGEVVSFAKHHSQLVAEPGSALGSGSICRACAPNHHTRLHYGLSTRAVERESSKAWERYRGIKRKKMLSTQEVRRYRRIKKSR